jgi:hypothetical protein
MNRLCMGNPQLPGEREQVTVAILPARVSPLTPLYGGGISAKSSGEGVLLVAES